MSNRKILKNTLALYIRQIIIVLINLYSLRVVLNALGVEDYGIYSAVVGLVTLLSFLPGTMASATQRYFSFAMGQQDDQKLRQTFSVNWLLYALIAICAFIILQTLGLWFVSEHLSIPGERAQQAVSLYKFTVFAFVASIFSSPFIAILIAHEDMHLYALISAAEAVLKLASAMLLIHLGGDALVFYGQLLLVVSVVIAATYIMLCLLRYDECQFRKLYWNQSLLREIIGFTGWTLFGQMSTVFRNQAITVLINQIFNPATVAARAIAITVANQALVFSHHFNTGLYPPIIKSYAANQKAEMYSLVLNGSKLTFFLMWVFALPMLLEMDAILSLWLVNPPMEAVLFTRLALVESLILSFSLPLATAARAPGKMRLYELSLGSIQIAIFIVCWLVLSAGYPAYWVFIVAIIANVIMFQVRLTLIKYLVHVQLTQYYSKVLLPIALVALLSALPGGLLRLWLPEGSLLWSAIVILVCVLSATVCMFFIGLDKHWRRIIITYLQRRLGSGSVRI
jgi:O-antigen/teichoic acid export membrane protein